jgi:signal transduction histidine kinase
VDYITDTAVFEFATLTGTCIIRNDNGLDNFADQSSLDELNRTDLRTRAGGVAAMLGAPWQYWNSRKKSSAGFKGWHPAVDARFSVVTLAPTRSQRWSTIAIAASLVAIFLATIPFANIPVPRLDGVNAIVEALVFGSYLVTAVLLFSQCSVIYSRALYALANGYLFSAVMVIAHALAYPGIFSPTGVIGSRTDTEAWIFLFWHFGFSASVICYAWLKDEKRARNVVLPSATASFSWSVIVSVAFVCAFIWAIKVLPRVIVGEAELTNFAHYIAGLDLLMSALALLLLWSRRRSILDLWLMIAVCARILALVTPALLISSRYTLGVYGIRLYLIVSAVAVLVALLWQTGSLYAQLVRSHMIVLHERNNKMLKLEAMAASIDHELKQPLAAIATNGNAALRFLGRERPDIEEAQAGLQRIVSDSHRAGDILTNIRRLFSRADVGTHQVDLNKLVRRVLDLLQEDLTKHRINTRIELLAEIPQILGNNTQLEEVVINLVNNAIQAMDMSTDGSRMVRISTELGDGETVSISVADTGPGIESSKISSIFEPFTTSKPNGTGLGLALSRMIVESHNGEISVSNTERGAKFEVRLPIERTSG